MDLEKHILHEKSFQEQPLNSEIPHFSTFTDHHCAARTNRLFIKGASKNITIPQRFMPVKTAFDMDDVQLFDYCQRNELLGNPEISSIFGNDVSQTDSKCETRVTASTSSTKTATHDWIDSANECHAPAADTSTKFSTCTAENLVLDNRVATKNWGQTNCT
jgi:hypothetical protein